MRRLLQLTLAFYLVLVQLTPTALWEELAKTDQLRAHYVLHRQGNPSLSFGAFLVMHYQDPSQHSEQHDHSGIPFSHSAHASGVHMFSFLPQNFNWAAYPTDSPAEELNQKSFYYQPRFVAKVFLSIWHPPKI